MRLGQGMKAVFDQRENNIDFVRIVLALLVILSHSYPLTLGHERTEPFMVLSRGQVTGGRIAVDLFFILSGFLISASYERSSSAVSFLRKRVARIYPGILLLSLVTLVLFAPLAHARVEGASVVAKILNVAGNTLRLAEWKYSGAFASNPSPGVINGSLWSIYYEFWCYIGVLVLGLTGLLRSRNVLAVLFSASIVVSLLFAYFKFHFSGGIIGEILGYPPFWARLLPMYLAGVVFYRFRDLIPMSRVAVGSCLLALAVACFVPLGYTALFPVAGTYLVMCFCFSRSIRLHQTNRFGDFSYGTYLYAFPLQQLILSAIGHSIHPLLLFACATPPTLLAAVISWYVVERRFLQAARKKKSEATPLVLELS
jgi:peptidoglycan/LPS O-acetylase OafA/YrhL